MWQSQQQSRAGNTSEVAGGRSLPPSKSAIDLSVESFAPQAIVRSFLSTSAEGGRVSPSHGSGPGASGSELGSLRAHAAMLLLTTNILFLTSAYLTGFGYLLTQKLPQLVDEVPLSLTAAAIGVVGVIIGRDLIGRYRHFKSMIERDFSMSQEPSERDRITKITQDLCQKHGIPMPLVCIDSGGPHMENRLFCKDVLCIPNQFAAKVSDPHLKAVIAHELAHIGDVGSYTGLFRSVVRFCAAPALMTSVFSTTFPIAESMCGTLPGYLIAGGLAALAAFVADDVSFRFFYRCRQLDEYRTDIRSVTYTSDPIGAIEALEGARNNMYGAHCIDSVTRGERRRVFWGESTHPSFQDRIDMIRRVFRV